MAVVLTGLAAWQLWGAWNTVVADRQHDVENLTLTLAQHASRSIESVSVAMGGLIDRLETEGMGEPALERVHRSVTGILPLLPQIGELVILDEQGRRLFDSAGASLLGTGSIAALMQRHRDERHLDVGITAPRPDDRRAEIVAIVSRRINRPDGSFGGVALATLSPAFYERFYERAHLSASDTVLLVSTDGILLLRHPFAADAAGRDLADTPFMRNAAVAMEHTFPVISPLSGVPRLLSYQMLSDYPLIVAAAFADGDFLAPWWQQVRTELTLLSLILLLIGFLFLRNDRLERARQKTARQYRLLAENCGDLVLIKGPDQRYEYVSPSCRAMLGYEPAELMKLRVEELLHPEDFARLPAFWRQMTQDHPVARTIVRYRRKDGRFIWVESVGRLATEGPHGNGRIIIASRDISARIQAEKDAEQAVARATLALEATSDFVYEVDRNWRLIYMNKRMRSSRYWQNKSGETLWDASPEMRGTPFETVYRRAMAERTSLEVTALCGPKRWFAAQVAPADGPDGGLFIFYRDVTAAKQAEDTLRADRDSATTIAKAKSDFMANMSHELRTPLNAVIGFAQMLEGAPSDAIRAERHRQYATDIRRSGEHLLEMINEILDYSKAEGGHLALHLEPFDPIALIESCVRMIAPRAERCGVEIVTDLRDAPASACADEKRVRQIVLNLLSNSVKFTLSGGRIDIVCRQEDGLVIAVADTGIGIAEADLGRVMEAFIQVDDRHNRSQEGTGLGLPLSRRLAEMHGGTLELTSRKGSGTTVTLRLPGSVTGLLAPASAEEIRETAA